MHPEHEDHRRGMRGCVRYAITGSDLHRLSRKTCALELLPDGPGHDAKSMHNSGQFDTSKRNGASASTLIVPIWRRPQWLNSLRLLAPGDPAPFTARLGGGRSPLVIV